MSLAPDPWAACMAAIGQNQAEVCLVLLPRIPHLERKDESGRTLLRLACQQDHASMRPVIRALVMAGANLDAPDSLGYTARDCCENKKLPEPIDAEWHHFYAHLLADREADVLSRASRGAFAPTRRKGL